MRLVKDLNTMGINYIRAKAVIRKIIISSGMALEGEQGAYNQELYKLSNDEMRFMRELAQGWLS